MHFSNNRYARARRRWDITYFIAAIAFVLSWLALFAYSFGPESKFLNPFGLKNPEFLAVGSIVLFLLVLGLAGLRSSLLKEKEGG